MKPPGILCIGGSSGAIDALRIILAQIPRKVPFSTVVALHRHRDSQDVLMRLLRSKGMPAIIEPFDKEPLSNGAVYLGPPDYHILVEPGHVSLSTDEPVHHSRPSIDVLFTSAAEAFGSAATCIVLSGANADGAKGSVDVSRRGGRVLVQDPMVAETALMPKAVLSALPHAEKLIPEEFSEVIGSALGRHPDKTGGPFA